MLFNIMKYIILITAISCTFEVSAESPALGRAASHAELAAAAGDVIWPDGHNLPGGQGSVAEGQKLYAARCIACHGVEGRGGSGGELAGGNPDLRAPQPDQTIGTYWPYATTLFDFVRRAMPFDAPRSLSDSEVYALVAYLLHLNGILAADAILDRAALIAVRMPNAGGFIGIEASYPRSP